MSELRDDLRQLALNEPGEVRKPRRTWIPFKPAQPKLVPARSRITL
jgi:hypothetical protein